MTFVFLHPLSSNAERRGGDFPVVFRKILPRCLTADEIGWRRVIFPPEVTLGRGVAVSAF